MKRTVAKSIYTLFICTVVLLGVSTNASAQTEKQESGVDFTVQGDIVSSYIWRGIYQSGAAVQPTLGLKAGGFTLTAWGSVDFTGQGHKEADITAAYTFGNLTISVADLWWAGQAGIYNDREAGRNKYFNFSNNSTDHLFEGGLSYTLPIEKLPLSLSWYTIFAGGDHKTDSHGKREQAFSTYAELGYPFQVKRVSLLANVGMSPFRSEQYKNDRFAVTNLSLKATKEIAFTDKFSLPVYTQVIWNPNREDIHIVFGITLR